MQTISSNLAKQTFGRVLETAQLEPVLIEKHNHPTAVILSVAEYDRLKFGGLNRSRPQSNLPIANTGVAKSLPVLPAKEGFQREQLSTQEMIDLVHQAEAELDV
jgi:prevent-host-death family protein